VVRSEIPRGLGNPDLFLSLSITSPSGRTVLEKREEVFKARRAEGLNFFYYSKEFPFYAAEEGNYHIRIEAHSHYITLISAVIKKRK